MNRLLAVLVVLMTLSAANRGWSLTLSPTRGSPLDLEVKGEIAGLAPGQTRYIPWAELRALPTSTLTVSEDFFKTPQKVTVLFLSDFLKALPLTAKADTLLATCYDGYASVFTRAFVDHYRPFFILEVNGVGPKGWPLPANVYNPGPYVITVSSALAPDAVHYLDLPHKKPSGIVVVEIASYQEKYAGSYSGPWASLSDKAKAGREIWINSCACCHPGPGGTFGGYKSGRPFPVLAAYAGYDQPYFKKYVRNPKAVSASAKMEAHPHYTDAQLDQLIAFITAEKPPAS